MSSVIETINLLKNASGSNEKKQILGEHNTENLRSVLFLSLNPYHSFYEKNLPRAVNNVPYNENDIIDMLRLSISGDRAEKKTVLSKVASMCESDEQHEFWSSVIAKDIDCGIGASTINAVIPNLIDVFDVAKAEEATHLPKLKPPFYVERKIDGSRCIAIYDGTTASVRTSSGREYPNMQHLKEAVIEAASELCMETLVLDGELLFTENGVELKRETSNGKANKALNGNLTPDEENDAKLIVFDVMTFAAFNAEHKSLPLHSRKVMLQSLPYINGLEYSVGEYITDPKDVMTIYNDMVVRGEEGIMVKEHDSPYERKRSKHWVKLKKEFEVDLEIIGWLPHKKHKDMIGSLLVQSSDGIVVGSVGTKMSDIVRKELKTMLDDGTLLNSICTVRIHDITDKKGQKSLYLPRFIELRNDKREADDYEKILKIITPKG